MVYLVVAMVYTNELSSSLLYLISPSHPHLPVGVQLSLVCRAHSLWHFGSSVGIRKQLKCLR